MTGSERAGRDGAGTGTDGTGRDGTGRAGTGTDGTGRDGTGRDGTGRAGWDGMGRGGLGRDGTGRDGTGWTRGVWDEIDGWDKDETEYWNTGSVDGLERRGGGRVWKLRAGTGAVRIRTGLHLSDHLPPLPLVIPFPHRLSAPSLQSSEPGDYACPPPALTSRVYRFYTFYLGSSC